LLKILIPYTFRNLKVLYLKYDAIWSKNAALANRFLKNSDKTRRSKFFSKKIQLPVTLFFGHRLPFVYAKQL